MNINCVLTPSHGWRLCSDSKYFVIPDHCYKSRPGDYVVFLGIDNSKYMFMAAVGDDIRGMVDFCKEHYIYDNLFIGVVEYLE